MFIVPWFHSRKDFTSTKRNSYRDRLLDYGNRWYSGANQKQKGQNSRSGPSVTNNAISSRLLVLVFKICNSGFSPVWLSMLENFYGYYLASQHPIRVMYLVLEFRKMLMGWFLTYIHGTSIHHTIPAVLQNENSSYKHHSGILTFCSLLFFGVEP